MLPFRALYPELAREETRVLHVFRGQPLPEGTYAFGEAYCTDLECDCRRVLLQVMHVEGGRQVATINYGFEPPEPPLEDEGQVFLDPMNPQSELSERLLEAFEKLLLTDEKYVARLHRHYEMWKRVVDDPTHPEHAKVRPFGRRDFGPPAFPKKPMRREGPKVGPNDTCPCGSGKKFKKCCMS